MRTDLMQMRRDKQSLSTGAEEHGTDENVIPVSELPPVFKGAKSPNSIYQRRADCRQVVFSFNDNSYERLVAWCSFLCLYDKFH